LITAFFGLRDHIIAEQSLFLKLTQPTGRDSQTNPREPRNSLPVVYNAAVPWAESLFYISNPGQVKLSRFESTSDESRRIEGCPLETGGHVPEATVTF
jgi:hypothetical protein